MGEVRPIPRLGGVVPDARGSGRALRISWHGGDDLVVLSLWDGARCTGTVRLASRDVPALVEALQLGLPPAPAVHPVPDPRTPAGSPGPTGPDGLNRAGGRDGRAEPPGPAAEGRTAG